MHVCMCVYIMVCMYVSIYVCTHTCTHTCIHTIICIIIYIHIYVYILFFPSFLSSFSAFLLFFFSLFALWQLEKNADFIDMTQPIWRGVPVPPSRRSVPAIRRSHPVLGWWTFLQLLARRAAESIPYSAPDSNVL
jgi:hypothetical protein